MASSDYTLDARYSKEDGRVLLSGIDALVRMLIDQRRFDRRQGLNTATFVSGYPGSPLGGFDLAMQRAQAHLQASDVLFVPGLNEELAATAVWGTQQTALAPDTRHDGVIGVWYGKAPGLDRSGDVFRHANTTGTSSRGGLVAIVGDDPSIKSSTIASHSVTSFYSKSMPVLTPGSIQDVLDLGIHAVALSRISGLCVGFQVVTDLADSIGTAEVGLDRIAISEPRLDVDGRPWRHVPVQAAMNLFTAPAEKELFGNRLEVARRYSVANSLNRITVDSPHPQLGVIAAGKTYLDVRAAFSALGLDENGMAACGVRLIKVGMPWPIDRDVIRSFAADLQELLVVEEKEAFLETLVKAALYGVARSPHVLGRRDENDAPLVPADGELSGDRLAPIIARLLPGHPVPSRSPRAAAADGRGLVPLPTRGPFFCSGCPHNRSTVVLEGSVAGGGIGCHGMALRSRVGTIGVTQMGGEGAQWIGRSSFTDIPHIFQNVGDGTFFHSASLALRACVAAGVNITFKLLYNGAIAMTGGQVPPGAMPVDRLVDLLLAEGVVQVVIVTEDVRTHRRRRKKSWGDRVDVRHRDEFDDVQRSLRDTKGATVLLYEQECAAELRRKRKRGLIAEPEQRVFINERVCEGCGDCGVKSNCLSVLPVETEFGRKTEIQQSSCNKDYTCIDGDCPSFVQIRHSARRNARPVYPELNLALPEPSQRRSAREWNAFIAGIGGTGVVTVNHILATAAAMEGLNVIGLDQTGLSQKAGPVVSHLKISDTTMAAPPRVDDGQADLFLGLDLLVSADLKNVRRASPQRTAGVFSSSQVPTGRMVTDVEARFPETAPILSALKKNCRDAVVIDSGMLANQLFADHMAANSLMIGVAYQAGFMPMNSTSIERALVLNGAAVEMNVAAFRWGRAAVAYPDRLRIALDAKSSASEAFREDDYSSQVKQRAVELLSSGAYSSNLQKLLEMRVRDLIDYQNASLAQRYLDLVEKTVAVESRVSPGREELSSAVATYFFKLLAYKDEYEVARLHLQPSFDRSFKAQFGSADATFLLHPPFLRALGMKRKVSLGRWFVPALVLLRALRRVRGTRLDVFGRTQIRALERQLPTEYAQVMEEALRNLNLENYDRAVLLARLPDQVRGYENIKLRNIVAYRADVARLRLEGSVGSMT